MMRMQEEEFDKMDFSTSKGKCEGHVFAKLYYLGTHSDYGCIKCGMKTLTPEIFNKESINKKQ